MFAVQTHQTRLPTQAAPEAVLAVASASLIAAGFEITDRDAAGLKAQGPGWTSTNQPGIRAASALTVRVQDGELSVDATLGGLATMVRFVWFFAPILVCGLTVLFLFLGLPNALQTLGMLIPFVLMSALMTPRLRTRAVHAVEAFSRSVAMSAAAGSAPPEVSP